MSQKINISIDYLKLYCVGGNWEDVEGVELKSLNMSSRHFKKISAVFLLGEKFGTLESEPFSSVLASDSSILKIENRQLYNKSLAISIRFLINSTRVVIKSITRLDIAIDFNYFKNKYYPENLITDFMKQKIRKKGRGHFIVSGSQANTSKFHYLRFGSRLSAVSVYLYNKSKEMEDVKFKPYIQNVWTQAGIDTDKPVWRLEFSMKNEATTFYNEATGEIQKMNWNDVIKEDVQRQIASSLLDKYFCFVRPNGQPRITRMPKIDLLQIERAEIVRIKLTPESDITRSDKVFLKSLHKVLRFGQSSGSEKAQEAQNLIEWMTESEFLYKYYARKRQEWDNEIAENLE